MGSNQLYSDGMLIFNFYQLLVHFKLRRPLSISADPFRHNRAEPNQTKPKPNQTKPYQTFPTLKQNSIKQFYKSKHAKRH